MENYSSLVSEFKSMVQQQWHHPLGTALCIPRTHRKIIRDVLRAYMQSAPSVEGTNVSRRPVNLYIRKYVDRNSVYKKIFVDDDWMKSHIALLCDHAKVNIINVNTLGKFYLMVVYAAMTGHLTLTNERIMDILEGVTENSTKTVVDSKTQFFCQAFCRDVSALASYYRNSAIYIGLPIYWWYGINAGTVYDNIEKILVQSNAVEYGRGVLAFLQFMNEVNKTDVKDKDRIKIAFNDHTCMFVMSVPEFIMDGLCFTAWDLFTKYGTSFTVDIFMHPAEHDGAFYKSVDHDQQGNLEQLSRPNTVDCSAVRISYYPKGEHKSNDENQLGKPGPGDIYYFEYGDSYNISRNYYERRDRLTYDGRCHEHRRVWMHADDDGTTYLRMLWDRYDGNIKVTPFRVGFDGSACVLPERVDKLLAPLEKTLAEAKTCCESNRAAGRHLEQHIETMRQYAVLVSNKTDVHTCRRPGAEVTRHAIDGSLPPPHVLGDWGARSYCGARRSQPRVSHGEKPWWWGRHAAIW
ncbi:A-type inclusion protein/fusion peptide hybrid [Orf virus]|uniref:A-type inclusion protein/fusion peptide hybrid n=1 Tax=Orf virus TaxID=10258 RepID=A0A0R8IEA8_ORFV|nr:A-type inclusion protein/fusion peptide hybrid [Orf virus]